MAGVDQTSKSEITTVPDWLADMLRQRGAAWLQRQVSAAGGSVPYQTVFDWLKSVGWAETGVAAGPTALADEVRDAA